MSAQTNVLLSLQTISKQICTLKFKFMVLTWNTVRTDVIKHYTSIGCGHHFQKLAMSSEQTPLVHSFIWLKMATMSTVEMFGRKFQNDPARPINLECFTSIGSSHESLCLLLTLSECYNNKKRWFKTTA